MYRTQEPYEIDDIILSEYGTTVVGLEMMRAQSEENEEQNRKMQVIKSAFNTLSYSEQEAIVHVFDEMKGEEGLLVASRIADRVGITRSVIVNALRKFESAGVIQSKSSGMKGTYIKVMNDAVYAQLMNCAGSMRSKTSQKFHKARKREKKREKRDNRLRKRIVHFRRGCIILFFCYDVYRNLALIFQEC